MPAMSLHQASESTEFPESIRYPFIALRRVVDRVKPIWPPILGPLCFLHAPIRDTSLWRVRGVIRFSIGDRIRQTVIHAMRLMLERGEQDI